MENKNVCVIGYGNIGQTVVRKIKAFQMNIKIYDPYYDYCKTIEEAIKESDFLIITCPLNNQTYHIINKNILSLMSKNAFVINVSRGSIINESDLIEMLNNKHIQGVALDVFEEEPLKYNSPLKKYNCIFGSHNGSNTIEAVDRTNKKVLDYILNNISS